MPSTVAERISQSAAGVLGAQTRHAEAGDAVWAARVRAGRYTDHPGSAWVLGAQTRHAVAGDAVWLARARSGAPRAEFVLDAIVERKSVADLLASVKGGRYEKQKYLLRRCGLRRLIYLIEGVPEAESAGVRSPI